MFLDRITNSKYNYSNNKNNFYNYKNNYFGYKKNLISCGILMYRIIDSEYYYLCVHPGGPYFKNKDKHCWSIPKGVVETNESLKDTACREFFEETGIEISKDLKSQLLYLGSIKQKGGKTVHAWIFPDPLPDKQREYKSNTFCMEYPKKSGNLVEFPEVDKIDFFVSADAKNKLNQAQAEFIKRWENIANNKNIS